MGITLSVHVAEVQDGSHAMLISLEGFDGEQEAADFAHTFLMDGRLEVGSVEFVPSEDIEELC